MMKSGKGARSAVLIFFLGMLIVWLAARSTLAVRYDQDIGGHLERAATANSVFLAATELKIALDSIEARGICPAALGAPTVEDLPTDCYTSVLWKTPDEDIAFWLYNLQGVYVTLLSLPPEDDLLKSNTLMMLRESLVVGRSAGRVYAISPGGISVYPNNIFSWWFGVVSLIGFFVAFVVKFMVYEDQDEW